MADRPGFSSTNPKTPVETQRDLRRLQKQTSDLGTRVDALEASKPTPHPAPKSIASSLQSNGPSPLNVTALPGVLSQPQLAKITRVMDFPPPADPRVVDGWMVLKDGVVWRFDAPTVSWIDICCGSGSSVKSFKRPGSGGGGSSGGGGPGPPTGSCAAPQICVTHCGSTILLSSVPFEQAPGGASGASLRQLYNCLQSVPGSWDLGCGNGAGAFIWPICGTLPINSSGQRFIPAGLIIGGGTPGAFQLKPCVILSPDGQRYAITDEGSCDCALPCSSGGHVTIPDMVYSVVSCGNTIILSNGAFTGPAAQSLYLQYLCINTFVNGWDFGCGNDAGAFIWPECDPLPIGPDGEYFIPAGIQDGTGHLVPWAEVSATRALVKDTAVCGFGGPCA